MTKYYVIKQEAIIYGKSSTLYLVIQDHTDVKGAQPEYTYTRAVKRATLWTNWTQIKQTYESLIKRWILNYSHTIAEVWV